MLLRRITQHVKDQNWFAVLIDFLIVVFGVYIGLQVQDWATEKKRLSTERQYLERLHDEVEQLIDTRKIYDRTRKEASQSLTEVAEILNSENQDISLAAEHCGTIVHSSFTTIPPADLPSATELISSGRLEQIASVELRDNILSYIQDVSRARDLITTLSDNNIKLSRTYPELFKTQLLQREYMSDSVDLIANCDIKELRSSIPFLNDFNSNAYIYAIYTDRGVLKVSQKLAELHAELDVTIGIRHSAKEVN